MHDYKVKVNDELDDFQSSAAHWILLFSYERYRAGVAFSLLMSRKLAIFCIDRKEIMTSLPTVVPDFISNSPESRASPRHQWDFKMSQDAFARVSRILVYDVNSQEGLAAAEESCRLSRLIS
jgi:hypothetical protein